MGDQLSLITESAKLEKCILCDGRGEMLDGSTCIVCKGEGERVPYDPATAPWPEGF